VILWDYLLLDSDVGYTTPTEVVPDSLTIPFVTIEPTSTTTVTITCQPPTAAAGSYGGALTSYTFLDPDFVINDADGIIYQTGLVPGVTYSLRIRAYSGPNATGTYGEYYYDQFTMQSVASVAAITSTVAKSSLPGLSGGLSNSEVDASVIETGSSIAAEGIKSVAKSLLTITSDKKGVRSVIGRTTHISTSETYYSFGAGLFFKSTLDDKMGSSGGIGFFTDIEGTTGYYVTIKTLSNARDNKEKLIKIYKIINHKMIPLSDSQDTDATTMGAILGATQYKLDVKVKVSATTVDIDVYINNFRITAKDITTGTSSVTKILPRTAGISLLSMEGVINFDYIYASVLTKEQYDKGTIDNAYSGQFAKGSLNFLFGERVASNFGIDSTEGGFLEEFGKVARELRKIKIKYNDAPGYPYYTSSGINPYINVIGSRLTTFGAEIYVLNNAGTFTPLSDGKEYSFNILGKSIHPSGQYEYSTSAINEHSVVEPVVFESVWIQTEPDAKSLADWIKTQWSKQQQSINLSVFGNPLISVGDVVSVDYPSNLDGTKKFVITNINNSFNQGLETSISARSIYV